MSYPQFKNKHLEEALFNPEHYTSYAGYKGYFPKKYIFVYSKRALSYFRKKYHPRKIKFSSQTDIYKYKTVGLVRMSGIGSPHAVTVIEELIALGGKVFLNIGLAGGLKEDGIFLCGGALRDEGTSHHYLPHDGFVYPDRGLTKKLGESIRKLNLSFSKGLTWTIDAPYRETKKEIEHYSKKGISTVEMEASALFAVGKYRKVKVAAAFVVSDVLKNEWKPRFYEKEVRKNLKLLVDAGVNCLTK